MTVGMSAPRVIRHIGLLPAMKNSATSGCSRARGVQRASRNVCANVSRYLLRIVGRWTSRAPFHSLQPAVDDVRAAVDDDLVAALA